MKITCPFCKVDYSINNAENHTFKCAVCGCIWRAPAVKKKSKVLVFLMYCIVLLLAAFSLIALVLWAPLGKQDALSVRMDSAQPAGEALIVSGVIENKSEKLHGVPDLIVVIKDDKNIEISTQKFAPPAPLLDAGEKANFSVQVYNVPYGLAKVSVKLNSQE